MHSESFHETFQHSYSRVAGLRLHYVIGGRGPTVVLLAGFPQSWYAWKRVMSILAESHTVIAIDLPGQGDSDKPLAGYETKNLAETVHGLITDLQVGHYFLAGHDVGAWVAFPYANMYGSEVTKLVLLDAGIPGVTLLEAAPLGENSWRSWHSFSRDPGFTGRLDLSKTPSARAAYFFLYAATPLFTSLFSS